MFRQSVHQTIHFTCLAIVAFSMPVSVWLMSAVSITGVVNWLLSGRMRTKIQILYRRKEILVLLALFGMYLLWLLNTSDFNAAISELKLKLPLLFFPLVIGSSTALSRTLMRIMVLSFIAGCVVATGAGYLALAGLWPAEVNDSRDLALFTSSVRLSVMLDMAIFSALWLFRTKETTGRALRIALLVAAAGMATFIFVLLSITGIVIFILILGYTGVYLVLKERQPATGLPFIALSVIVLILSLSVFISAERSLTTPSKTELNVPHLKTQSGRPFTHYPEETLIENGYLVWMNVCEEELRREWNSRSSSDYDGRDRQGNELRVTLIRYITYLGMLKDSSAVAALSPKDITYIEKGFANPLYAHPGDPRAKAYELAWQFDRAGKGANPSGHSVTQRLEFYKAAAGIIKEHPWLGTGTGDIRNAFIDEYNRVGSPLTSGYRLRAHNQFLTFGITFGIPGLIIAILVMFFPWVKSRNRTLFPFMTFILIFFLSMFNDDNFGSFTGATFFSYFYTLFLNTDYENEKDA